MEEKYNIFSLKIKYKKLIIIICCFIFYNYFYLSHNTNINTLNNESVSINQTSRKNETKNMSIFDQIQEYILMNENGTLINDINSFKRSDFPKISISISVYNGELFIKQAVRSIQNQNFTDIEIIIVDDNSSDNSISIIKELMKEDPRIILLTNNVNKGALYTKTKGILNSKGKYVLSLDVDDMYSDENCFSILYEEAEKNDLDILGFSSIISQLNITKKEKKWIHRYNFIPLLHQPNISSMMYRNNGKEIQRIGDVIWCYLFKTEFFKSVILNEIDQKYLNRIMNVHDDFLLLFILTRKAKSYKCIKKIFHFCRVKTPNKALINYNIIKRKLAEKYNCLAYLYYSEFILSKTDNNYKDKLIASAEFNRWYLDNKKCNNNTNIINQGIYVSNLFLNNSYINNETKTKINLFLNKLNKTIYHSNIF